MKSKRNSSRMDSSKSLKRASKKNSVRVSSKLESKLYDYEALNILRYEDFETLKVHNGDRDYHVETDRNFLTDVEKIAKIRKNIIFNIFDKKKQKVSDLDCDNIDFKARLHKDANVVNTNTNKSYEDLQPNEKCACGCKRGKGENLPFCTDEQKLNVLGPGPILMFLFKRATAANLFMIILIYGIFALVTNLIGEKGFTDECQGDTFCEFKKEASDENKIDPKTNELVQLWLGFGFCFIWIITLRFIKYLGREKNRLVDERLRSASDYAIKIQNLPYGSYSQNQLIDYFEGLYEKMKIQEQEERGENVQKTIYEDDGSEGNHFKMRSIQIIYNMEFSRKMVEQIFFLSYMVDNYVEKAEGQKQRKYVRKVEQYKVQKAKLKQTYELLLDLRKKFLNDADFRKSISTTCCIIQFNDQYMKKKLLHHFGIEKVGLIKQIQTKVKKFFKPESKDIIFKGNVIKIERAPEPSDILYTNCEKMYSLKRILFIYMVTLLIIVVSFGIISGLDYLQEYIETNDITDDSNLLTFINICMSAGLLIVNKFLWFALFYLLQLQYNHTLTQKIVSQMNKVLLASSINVIVLPIISNVIVRDNLYGVDGLSGLVFDYHISVIVGLAVKLFDPLFLIKKVVIQIKCLRNLLIRWTCSKLPDVNPEKGVNEVNKFYEGTFFDIAETYVYIIGAIIHAAFFCHLQPFILILVTGMIASFYFINKIKILRYCKIPEMTELLVFETALSQAGLVPIIYGTGSIVISYLEYLKDDSLPINYVPSAICIGIGFFGIFNPCDILNKIVKKIMQWFECISVEKLIGDESDDNFDEHNVTNQVAETLQGGDKATTNRIQVYIENSNALSLLGFEKVLRGEEEKQIMGQLEHFCESFFPNDKLISKTRGLDFIADKLGQNQQVNVLGFMKPRRKIQQMEEMEEDDSKMPSFQKPMIVMPEPQQTIMVKDEAKQQNED